MLETIDFMFIWNLLRVANKVRGNFTNDIALSVRLRGEQKLYTYLKDNLVKQFDQIHQLVKAWNTQCPTSSIDELFYQLSDGVIRYTKGQICILTHPESTEPIDPEDLI